MAYEQRDNSGTIFVNDRKEKDNQPDRTGTAMIDGKMYRVSGWLKQGQRGPFLSLSFTPSEQAATAPTRSTISERATPKPPAPGRRTDMDDEVPF